LTALALLIVALAISLMGQRVSDALDRLTIVLREHED
jgi:hypothetical protein